MTTEPIMMMTLVLVTVYPGSLIVAGTIVSDLDNLDYLDYWLLAAIFDWLISSRLM